jgi:tetratricopeptide (TPR) repeat protein
MKRFIATTLLCSLIPLGAMAGEIQILSAVKKDKTISGAEVILQKAGESSKVSHSGSNGLAKLSGFSDTRDTTLIIKKSGYSTLVAQCPCDGLTYALSPNMSNLDGMRAVLTWGRNPSDLDSHLAYQNNHIFFHEKRGDKAHLDVDDIDSFGPETITIVKKKQGQKYLYAVHNYSKGTTASSKGLGISGATVRVYIGQTLVRTYKATPQKIGNIWVVFGIDENGAFKDINSYLGTKKSSDGVKEVMRDILGASSFSSDSVVSASQKAQAKELNRKGEKAYHNKELESAMYLFQDAINLYPEYGQAYSNLGLTFQKLHRDAEALWANRKAIERASGSRAKTVKASSYYNIAKVYESQGKWEDALSNYENALYNKEHSAYHKGIKRMKKKLGR